ncbi:hypothetical protein Efla_000150 [Eimeria flavescens]
MVERLLAHPTTQALLRQKETIHLHKRLKPLRDLRAEMWKAAGKAERHWGKEMWDSFLNRHSQDFIAGPPTQRVGMGSLVPQGIRRWEKKLRRTLNKFGDAYAAVRLLGGLENDEEENEEEEGEERPGRRSRPARPPHGSLHTFALAILSSKDKKSLFNLLGWLGEDQAGG